MDYGKILRRAWEITWRWKVLWVLGFLSALGNARNGSNWSSSYSTEGREWEGILRQIPAGVWGIIASVTCLAILIGIALWVISVIARGGLIAGVTQIEEEGATQLGRAWKVGAGRFWTLVGIGILATLPFLLLLFLGIAVIAVGILSGGGEGRLAVPGFLCGASFCCGAILLAIVLEQIRIYAERAAILEDLGWLEAFARGWKVLKTNIGPTLIFWLIFFVLGLMMVFAIGGGFLAMLLPLVGVFANTDPGPWIGVPVCCGGLLAFVVLSLISAIVQTFTSTTWTLAYREMTGLVVLPVPEE